MSLSSGMHRKLLVFYGKGENVILLKFWKQQLYTRLLFLSIIVEISSANERIIQMIVNKCSENLLTKSKKII